MDAEFKAKWVAALRSGEYAQVREYLHLTRPENSGFCCIGVACDVAGIPGYDDGHGHMEYDGLTGCPSDAVRYSLGLDLEPSRVLVKMNDDDGKSFAEIADWIEAHL